MTEVKQDLNLYWAWKGWATEMDGSSVVEIKQDEWTNERRRRKVLSNFRNFSQNDWGEIKQQHLQSIYL